ncbi:MAG: DNA-binding NtrC family response regulator [Hyphomicrobiaceae bacterium]|jgi:DNA-binding NtrC family response regulator
MPIEVVSEPSVRVLIVEEDPTLAGLIRRAFDGHPGRFVVSVTGSVREARLAMENVRPGLVIADVAVVEMEGWSLLALASAGQFPVIAMSDYGHDELGIAAVKAGASEYVVKSAESFAALPDSALAIFKGWQRTSPAPERSDSVQVLRREPNLRFGFDRLVGGSDALRNTRRRIHQVARTSSTVLITGESGVGKEVVARAIHRASDRSEMVFLPVNCAAIPTELLESQLFGHMRGSFSGAVTDHEGLFQKASGGTIFLDEIGEMPVGLQSKLLRAIEAKEFLPVGATTPVRVELRILAATNVDIDRQVALGQFREDLYYRLNVFAIEIPPLRERLEDVPLLVEHFMAMHNQEMQRSFEGIEEDALSALLSWSWRGNVRELDNVIEHAMIVGDGEWIRPCDLPGRLAGAREIGAPVSPHSALKPAIRHFERTHIAGVLRSASGDKRQAAELLDIGVSTLYRKLEELEIDSEGNLVDAPPVALVSVG